MGRQSGETPPPEGESPPRTLSAAAAPQGERAVPIGEQQSMSISNLEGRLVNAGVHFERPDIDLEEMHIGLARTYEVYLKGKLRKFEHLEQEVALRHTLQDNADRELLVDEYDLSSGIDPTKLSKGDRARLKQYREDKDVGVFVGDEADLYRKPSLPWHWKILPPYSRQGLGANPKTRERVFDGLNAQENMGRDTAGYLKRLQQTLKEINPSRINQAFGSLGMGRGKELIEQSENLKRQLMRALDAESPGLANRILEENQSLIPAYNEIRSILDEIADQLNLPEGSRIINYFPHVFNGKSGHWRANRVLQELGGRGRFLRGLMPVDDGAFDDLPFQKRFGNLLEREGRAGYDQDLEAVIYSYVRGAMDKVYMDPQIKRAHRMLRELPRTDGRGNENPLHKEFRKWMAYMIGAPTNWKHTQSMWWRENDMFNRWVDKAVEFLGDAPISGMLERARKGRMDSNGQRIPYSAQEEKILRGFFDTLVTDADRFVRHSNGRIEQNVLKEGFNVKRYRARLALWIDDIRAALSDPAGKPVILEKLYGLMVVNKLGLSISHGLINLTQMANTYTRLGARYTSRGIAHYVSDPKKTIGSKEVGELLEESGVLVDFPEAKEFVPAGSMGLWADIDNALMTPATASENFLRASTFLGKYEEMLDKGMDHAHAFIGARQLVQTTQFPFNRAGTIPAFRSPLARFLLMFKSYGLHQMNFSAEVLQEALEGNPAALQRHILAYLTMAGVGATVLGDMGIDTNFGDRSQHPLLDIQEGIQERGLVRTLGGPPSAAMIEALHGQFSSAMDEVFTPTIKKRIGRALETGNPLEAMGLAGRP